MVQDAAEIEAFVRERGITHLVHFTRVANLGSIFKLGLVPKSVDLEREMNNKIDGNEHNVCLSMGHPSNMFYHMRDEGKADTDWCVLVLTPRVLWECDCLFYPINAVSKILRERGENEFLGEVALNAMFALEITDPRGKTQKRAWYLEDNMPTNEQAEVHVRGKIPISYIYQIHFHKESGYAETMKSILPLHVETYEGVGFWSSRDYWLNGPNRKEYLKWLKDRFS